jgi:hypothetical protein
LYENGIRTAEEVVAQSHRLGSILGLNGDKVESIKNAATSIVLLEGT